MKRDRDYLNSTITELINERVHKKVYREILKSHFVDGLTYEELAEKYNYSVRQCKNIVDKEGDRVLKYI